MRFPTTRRNATFVLSLPDRLALEKLQRQYHDLVRDFVGEVIELIGSVENPKHLRQARQEMAGAVADAIALFIARHSGPENFIRHGG